MSKFRIRVVAKAGTSGSPTLKLYEADFEKVVSQTRYGIVCGGKAQIKGDGTAKGGVFRRFPGRAPATVTKEIFNDSRLGRCEVWLRKTNAADTLDANKEVFVYLWDQDTTWVWVIMTVDPADITSYWQAFHVKFRHSLWATLGGVRGRLFVGVNTPNSKPIDVNKLLISAGDQIFTWIPSSEELADGYVGQFEEGSIEGYPTGEWVENVYKISGVS